MSETEEIFLVSVMNFYNFCLKSGITNNFSQSIFISVVQCAKAKSAQEPLHVTKTMTLHNFYVIKS